MRNGGKTEPLVQPDFGAVIGKRQPIQKSFVV